MGGTSRSLAAVALLLSLSSATALAEDDAVAKRLTKYGQLRRGESESVAADVSKRMRRAADMTSADDPLRLAVARALGTPNTKDAMVAAKVRLRLYAGLNEWALDKLFAPKPGGLAQCQQDLGLSSRHCEALIAASGKVSAAEASKLAAGPAPTPKGARPMASQPMAAAAPQGKSRFGQRFDSGFRGGATGPAAPTQRPMPATAMRPAPAPMAAASPTNTRAEYQKRRQEYLERQKREMEARKAKVVATAVGDMPQRGPASAAEAEVVGADPSEVAAAEPAPAQAKAAPGAKGKAAPAEEVAAEEAPAEEAPKKEALDNSFLEGLLDDPLGGKK